MLVLAIELYHDNEAKIEDLLSKVSASNLGTARQKWKFCADPLHCAAARGRIKVVKRLLEAGFEVNSVTEDAERGLIGATALHLAALHAQWKVVKLLMEKGADADLEAVWTEDGKRGRPRDWAPSEAIERGILSELGL